MGRHDPINILEAAYSLEGKTEQWLRDVIDATSPALDRGDGIVAFVTTFEKMFRGEFSAIATNMPGDPFPMLAAVNANAPPEMGAMLMNRAWAFGSVTETIEQMKGVGNYDRKAAEHGIIDAVCLFAQDGEGGVLDISALSARRMRTTEAQRGLWSKLAAHLTAMTRLRRHLQPTEDAVLRPDGRVSHAQGKARDAREELVDAVRTREKARGRMRREDPEHAVTIWRGLVHGQWSLVDRFERDGARFVVAYPNAPDVVDPRRLTKAEKRVVHYAARGAANKEIAYALGVSNGTVAALLARACRKLRVRRRSELASLPMTPAATVVNVGDVDVVVDATPDASPTLAGLTEAEVDVAKAVASGASDAEIAKRRGTSKRTVSNQLARIYRKLGLESRAELAALMASTNYSFSAGNEPD